MIVDTLTPNIETYGDVKEFKTSINPEDLEFITTLLSSNLYSNPEKSFIREIVSNAWDSHIEAGTTNIPILIRIGDKVTIRDYGTGLSPERFNSIYRNIGSSTKRESNDYIGAFGIGHLSTFACSNTTYIISYYKGTAYHYVGSKSNNSIVYHLVNSMPTTEKDGLEVSIPISDKSPYIDALKHVIFFPNIYVDIKSNYVNKINDNIIKKHKYYSVSRLKTYDKILLGTVLYPCDKTKLSQKEKEFLSLIENSGVVINFNIGELPVTPNRENIIYSEKAINTIKSRIAKAEKEFIDNIKSKLPDKYTNIRDYYTYKIGFLYNPLTEEIIYKAYLSSYYEEVDVPIRFTDNNIHYFNIPFEDSDKENSTLINSASINQLRIVLNCQPPYLRGAFKNDKFITMINRFYSVEYYKSATFILINEEQKLTQTIKNYIKQKFKDNTIVLSNISLKKAIAYYLRINPSWVNKPVIEAIIKSYYKYIIDNAVYIDFKTDTDFLKYKTLHKNEENPNTEDIIIKEVNRNWSKKKTFLSLDEVVKYIKSFKKGVILVSYDTSYNYLADIAEYKNYIFLRAKKNIVKKINKLNLKCIVDLDWLTDKDPLLAKLNTFLTCKTNYGISINTYLTNKLLRLCNITDRQDFKELIILDSMPLAYKRISQDKGFDSSIKSIFDKYVKYINSLEKCLSYMNNTTYEEILVGLLIKTKSFRVDYKCYNQFKENPLTSILCKK